MQTLFKLCYRPYILAQEVKTTVRVGDKTKSYPIDRILTLVVGSRFKPEVVGHGRVTSAVAIPFGEITKKQLTNATPDAQTLEGMRCSMWLASRAKVEDEDMVTLINYDYVTEEEIAEMKELEETQKAKVKEEKDATKKKAAAEKAAKAKERADKKAAKEKKKAERAAKKKAEAEKKAAAAVEQTKIDAAKVDIPEDIPEEALTIEEAPVEESAEDVEAPEDNVQTNVETGLVTEDETFEDTE